MVLVPGTCIASERTAVTPAKPTIRQAPTIPAKRAVPMGDFVIEGLRVDCERKIAFTTSVIHESPWVPPERPPCVPVVLPNSEILWRVNAPNLLARCRDPITNRPAHIAVVARTVSACLGLRGTRSDRTATSRCG